LTHCKSFDIIEKFHVQSSSAPVLPPYCDMGRPGVGPEVPVEGHKRWSMGLSEVLAKEGSRQN